jgi:hypothetical protein
MLFPSRSVLLSQRMSGFSTLSSSVCITRDAGSTSRNGKRWLVSGLGSTSPHFDWGRPRQRSPAQPPRAAPPPWPSARPVPGQRPPRSRRPGCWHTRSHNSGGQHIRAATRLLVSRAGRDRRQVRLGVVHVEILGQRSSHSPLPLPSPLGGQRVPKWLALLSRGRGAVRVAATCARARRGPPRAAPGARSRWPRRGPAPVVALAARWSGAWWRTWIVSTRACRSCSDTPWQVRQARLILRSGLHPVIADLQRAGPLVGHVAVRARDPGAGGHALTPDLELRVLRLQHLVPGLGVDPVRDILRVVVGLDLEREGVAREDPLEPRIPVELLLAEPASLARARGPRTWWWWAGQSPHRGLRRGAGYNLARPLHDLTPARGP